MSVANGRPKTKKKWAGDVLCAKMCPTNKNEKDGRPKIKKGWGNEEVRQGPDHASGPIAVVRSAPVVRSAFGVSFWVFSENVKNIFPPAVNKPPFLPRKKVSKSCGNLYSQIFTIFHSLVIFLWLRFLLVSLKYLSLYLFVWIFGYLYSSPPIPPPIY